MAWKVEFYEEFAVEFSGFDERVREEILALVTLLRKHGHNLGRPHSDTLEDSKYSNMKELRVTNNVVGPWRILYAFDPKRRGILLIAGNKGGKSEKTFYKRIIKKADERYAEHLESLKY